MRKVDETVSAENQVNGWNRVLAAAWLGHTEEIADADYRQVLPSHFDKATQIPTQTGAEIGDINGKAVIRPLRENEKAPEFPGLSVPGRLVQGLPVGGGGNRTPVL